MKSAVSTTALPESLDISRGSLLPQNE